MRAKLQTEAPNFFPALTGLLLELLNNFLCLFWFQFTSLMAEIGWKING